MTNGIINKKAVRYYFQTQRQSTLKVSGFSMEPSLYDGDVVTIVNDGAFTIGDVLVFFYNGDFLIHRLLKVNGSYFICKGDNSFRIESLIKENIIGKAVLVNGHKLDYYSDINIKLSILVNREFVRQNFDVFRVKTSLIYRLYRQTVWNVKDSSIRYKKNNNVVFLCKTENEVKFLNKPRGKIITINAGEDKILNAIGEVFAIDDLLKLYLNATGEQMSYLFQCVAKFVVLDIVYMICLDGDAT